MAFFGNLLGSGKLFSDRMRYVDDFKIEEYRDARGKTRRKAVYIGPWTVLNETGGRTLAKIIGAAALAAFAAAAFVNTLLIPQHASSGSLFVMIPLYAALFPTLYLVMGAFSLPYRQKPMRRDQYMHGITRMQRSSVAILVFLAVGVIASFIYRISVKDWLFRKEDIWFLVGCGASALLFAGLLWLLGSIEVHECANDAVPSTETQTP